MVPGWDYSHVRMCYSEQVDLDLASLSNDHDICGVEV